MTKIYYESDADSAQLEGESLAIVGYGNQGRSWALNLRDSGLPVQVCVRADATRERAQSDGFDTLDVESASDMDIACILVPDDVISRLDIQRPNDGLTIVASGYSLAFNRYQPGGDVGLVAPRMLGPEVRLCYQEGTGFVTAVGVERDGTGRALARVLAIAQAIGGLRQGAIELSAHQEAVLDLSVEQVLSPALTHVNGAFVQAMLSQGIPIEAVLLELFLSGEVERNYRLLREEGFVAQLDYHSPTSQYGQLSRRGSFDSLDFAPIMARLVDHIASGCFADEWDEESEAEYQRLRALREQHAGPDIKAFEESVRSRIGPAVLKD
ncbi:MAG: ketol-acid reductoisomerase [Deltaproteobacteria bacterium]|nr:ketol-acid reductoisomerase [Deltaproteobacteria bacterium]MBW2382553.1 ketol-acid reductoisomerase [Deltaproteobacteria bacterium]MBW2695659.1 ketol-acid reductoisomerase [Deltaproteobacteria bacterium]